MKAQIAGNNGAIVTTATQFGGRAGELQNLNSSNDALQVQQRQAAEELKVIAQEMVVLNAILAAVKEDK